MTDEIAPESSPEPNHENVGSNAEHPSAASYDAKKTDAEAAESSPAPEETAEDQEAQKRNKINERFAKVTREKYEAINKAKELEEKYQKLQERIDSLDTGPSEPNFDDYETVADYNAAYRDFVLENQKRETQKQQRSASVEDTRRQSEKEQMERANKFVSKLKAEEDRYEGLFDKLQDPGFQAVVNSMNPDIIAQIQTSDKSTALSYHLATNIDVADAIARLSPVEAARELALIEVGLETPSPKKISNAPAPIDPIGSGGASETPLNKISDIDEWMAKRNAQVLNRR